MAVTGAHPLRIRLTRVFLFTWQRGAFAHSRSVFVSPHAVMAMAWRAWGCSRWRDSLFDSSDVSDHAVMYLLLMMAAADAAAW